VQRTRTALAFASVLTICAAGWPARAQTTANTCSEWHECQRLALDARERGEFERFHDLAWRTVQTGPRNDPALMYLLARAQALSGRPHDALVMLGRIADAGALPADAMTSDEFTRVRQLAGWAEFEARITMRPVDPAPPAVVTPPRGNPEPKAPERSTAAAAPVVAVPAAAPADAAPVLEAPVEASRFRSEPFSIAGLAYDAVSQRFLFGDRLGRKLRIVGDREDHSVDLTRAESGGFRDIGAIAIDRRRGDLWVASADAAGSSDAGGLLHKLQLISGRALKAFPIASDAAPVRPVDLAVGASGLIVVLDAGAARVLTLRPGHDAVQVAVRLKDPDPASIALAEDEDLVYVAHANAIARANLRSGAATAVAMPSKESTGPLEWIRLHRGSIVAIERTAGSRRVLRLDLNGRGTAVAKIRTLADNLPAAGRISASISGDELAYVIDGGDSQDVIVYRVHLK
jgi:hypothetical protein